MAIINRTKSNTKTNSDNQHKPWAPRLEEIAETLTKAGAEKAARVAELDASLTEVNGRIKGAEGRMQNSTSAKDYAAAKREKADAEAEAEYYRAALARAQEADVIGEGEWLGLTLEYQALSAQPRGEWQRIAAPILEELAEAWAEYTAQYDCFAQAAAALSSTKPKVVHYNGGIVTSAPSMPDANMFEVTPTDNNALRELYVAARDVAKRAASALE